MAKLLTTIAFTLAAILPSHADEPTQEFRLAKILADKMVLQQEKPITIWGWAKPGSEVSVTLTRDAAAGASAVAKTKESESTPRKSTAPDTAHTVTMRYEEKNAPAWPPQTLSARAEKDGRWSVKFSPVKASFQPAWIIAESAGKTLAIADILIGEVWVCAGQSNMEWKNFNRKGLIGPTSDCPGLRYVSWNDSYYKPLDDIRNNVGWTECTPASVEKFSSVPYLYGMMLHRYLKVPVGIINIARGGTTGDTWTLRQELDGIEHVSVKETLRQYDAETSTWDKPEGVKRIMDEWQQSISLAKATHEKEVAKAKAEGKKEPRLRLPKEPEDPRSGWSPPAGLFNATVAPIRHLGVRGVLYYQGENNVFRRWTNYEYTFPKVPVSFRKAFGEPELPFGCISLPGWGTFGKDPEIEAAVGGYAIIRDIHTRALKGDPNSGLIATYPTGNSFIHPAEKYPVAEYSALWALAKVYGQPLVHRANEYQKMTVKDGKAYVYFDADPIVYAQWKHLPKNAAWQVLPQPYQGSAPIEGFIIAGEDRRWYPAKAKDKLVDNTWTIEVWSDLVEKPVAVRYGWANWPTGNLVGRENLPVPTFRSDDWPIIEGVSYSKEVLAATLQNIARVEKEAELQAIDRKIRQMKIDLPALEAELLKLEKSR